MNITNIENNTILKVDSYKLSHFKFQKPNTTKTFSYIEPRKGGEYKEVKVFGLQAFLKKNFLKPITEEMVNQAEAFCIEHGEPFNRKGWMYIILKHNGMLPLKIKAVKEGTLVPEGNVIVTVENTDPNCAWLTSYFETPILSAMWYGTTVATRSYEFKKLIKEYLEKTGDPSLLPFKLVDFGSRGATSVESSGIAGAAHLTNFMATDNIPGIVTAMKYYNTEQMVGFSIPASEHSVTCEYGEEHEKDFFEHAIDTFGGPGKLISIVIDSYDMMRAIKYFGEDLKDKLIESGSTIVFRPDSGLPLAVVEKVIVELEKYFGCTINEKGYKVLNPCARIIQGDGVDLVSVYRILNMLKSKGYSADNITFGCGGYLLQQVNRDTLRFAMKASYTECDGIGMDICKNPKTDPSKASKKGRITLVKDIKTGEIKTINESELNESVTDLLETVFENGKLLRDMTFENIRTQ